MSIECKDITKQLIDPFQRGGGIDLIGGSVFCDGGNLAPLWIGARENPVLQLLRQLEKNRFFTLELQGDPSFP